MQTDKTYSIDAHLLQKDRHTIRYVYTHMPIRR